MAGHPTRNVSMITVKGLKWRTHNDALFERRCTQRCGGYAGADLKTIDNTCLDQRTLQKEEAGSRSNALGFEEIMFNEVNATNPPVSNLTLIPIETRKRAVVTDDVVERILLNYQLMRKINSDQVEASREKIAAYIKTLNIARQFDAHQLTMYGLAYLKELHEGRDKRFSGC